MYSIHVFLKNEEDIEFIIGTSWALSFIYQPARYLGLMTIFSLNEDKDLINQNEIKNFFIEIEKLYEFWGVGNNDVNGYIPNDVFVHDLSEFIEKIRKVSIDEVKSISVF